MVFKCVFSRCILFLVPFCVGLATADDDEPCAPGVVRNLQLSDNNTLSWDPPLIENCEISHYLVIIFNVNTHEDLEYVTEDTTLDIGHLTPCLRYVFQVAQVTTENVSGSFSGLSSLTPPPSGADLALDYLTVIPDGRDVRLEWSLLEEWIHCATRYRVVIVNEPLQTVTDVYTYSPAAIAVGLMGCATYTFTVSALFTLEQEGPPSVVKYEAVAAETSVPVIEDISLKHTGTTLTLGLQSYEHNRCPIRTINIDGGRYFNASFPVTDQENRQTFKASLSRLQADTLYYIKVSATNTAGTTRPTLLAFQTLD